MIGGHDTRTAFRREVAFGCFVAASFAALSIFRVIPQSGHHSIGEVAFGCLVVRRLTAVRYAAGVIPHADLKTRNSVLLSPNALADAISSIPRSVTRRSR